MDDDQIISPTTLSINQTHELDHSKNVIDGVYATTDSTDAIDQLRQNTFKLLKNNSTAVNCDAQSTNSYRQFNEKLGAFFDSCFTKNNAGKTLMTAGTSGGGSAFIIRSVNIPSTRIVDLIKQTAELHNISTSDNNFNDTTVSNAAVKSANHSDYKFFHLDASFCAFQKDSIDLLGRSFMAKDQYKEFSTLTNNAKLSFLCQALQSKTTKLVIVVDNVQVFTQYPTQALLYNILNSTSVGSNIFIGITLNINIVDMLEKRVKSRFSNNILSYFDNMSFQFFQDYIHNFFIKNKLITSSKFKSVGDDLSQLIPNLLTMPKFKNYLQKVHMLDPTPNRANKLILDIVFNLTICKDSSNPSNSVLLDIDSFVASRPQQAMTDLSIIELVVLMLVARIVSLKSDLTFTYKQVYEDLLMLVNTTQNKAIMVSTTYFNRIFDNLQNCKFVIKDNRRGSNLYHLNISKESIDSFVNKNTDRIPTSLLNCLR